MFNTRKYIETVNERIFKAFLALAHLFNLLRWVIAACHFLPQVDQETTRVKWTRFTSPTKYLYILLHYFILYFLTLFRFHSAKCIYSVFANLCVNVISITIGVNTNCQICELLYLRYIGHNKIQIKQTGRWTAEFALNCNVWSPERKRLLWDSIWFLVISRLSIIMWYRQFMPYTKLIWSIYL